MQPSEIATGFHYLDPLDQSPYMIQSNTPAFHFDSFCNIPQNFQIPNCQVQEFSLQSSCLSSNSTSDEADEQQLSIINERKRRRMISNRESARRSRMRKQKHLDELWSQVVWLRNENHQLIDKLNHVSESHEQVLQENAQLKEATSELREMLSNMQLNRPYATLNDLPNQSITSSADLLG